MGVAPTAERGPMHQLTQLVQTQTAMVVAQTQAMSTQSLPPMPRYSGEGDQTMDDGFDRWVDSLRNVQGWRGGLMTSVVEGKL